VTTAGYNVDAELSQELTLGLLRSPAIVGAQLTDNNGTVLASVKPADTGGYFNYNGQRLAW